MPEAADQPGALLDRIAAFLNLLDQAGERRIFDQALGAIASALTETLGAAQCIIWIPNPEEKVLDPACSNGPADQSTALSMQLKYGDSRCGVALRTGRSEFYPTLETAPASCAPPMFAQSGLVKMWVVPLIAPPMGENEPARIIAVASVHFRQGDAPEGLPASFVELCGHLAGRTLELALWIEQDVLINSTSEAKELLDSSTAEAFDMIAASAARALNFEACSLFVANPELRLLRLLGTTGLDTDAPRRDVAYEYGQRATGIVAEREEILALEDFSAVPLVGAGRFPDRVQTPGMRQFLGAPILSGGSLVGVIRLRNKRAPAENQWPRLLNFLDWQRVRRVARIVSPLLALVIEESRQDAMIERMRHDMDMPATMIRDFAAYYSRLPGDRLRDLLPEVQQKLADVESTAEIILSNSELMHLSRASAITLSPQPTNIKTECVVKLCKMLTPAARRRKLERVSYGGGASFDVFPLLLVDPRLLEIALYNLLQNAIKYSFAGTEVLVEGDVVKEADGQPWYRIHVRNFGIGISDKAAPRVFERYYRSPEAKAVTPKGVGIGLSTARSLVELHGGRLELTRKDQPTVFTIWLPASLASRPPQPPAPSAPAVPPGPLSPNSPA